MGATIWVYCSIGDTITFSHLVTIFGFFCYSFYEAFFTYYSSGSFFTGGTTGGIQALSTLSYPPGQLIQTARHKSQIGLSSGHETQVILLKYGLFAGQFEILELTE